MDKKLFSKIILVLIFSLFSFVGYVGAQEEVEDEQFFQVSYDLGRQSVWNNSIPINVYITPREDYNRVEVTFNHSSMVEHKYTGPQYFAVKKGQIYKVTGKIYPKEKGLHKITINAISWEHNANYTSSVSATVDIDENLQIIPQTQAYKIFNILKILLIIVIIIGIVVVAYLLIKKNLQKIKDWLEPEF